MPLSLYAHPFSSYCQKVLVALYQNGTPFELRMLGPGHSARRRSSGRCGRSSAFRCWSTTAAR